MFAIASSRFFRNSLATMTLLACGAVAMPDAMAQSSSPPLRPKRTYDPEQYYKSPSTMKGKTVIIPMGTAFEGRIDHTISSAHSREGERFYLIMSAPVLLNGTDVIIPAGSKIIGEIVEAVPAGNVPVNKSLNQDKRLVNGKLRIQISGLQTPDGVTYPLVGAIAGEIPHGPGASNQRFKAPIGTGVAYMGSAAGFEGVNANQNSFSYDPRTGRMIPKLVTRKDYMKDQIYGNGGEGYDYNQNVIRALVLRKRNYYLYEGSALSVRLTAPFKIGINPPTMGVPMGEVSGGPVEETLPPPSASAAGSGRFRSGEGTARGGADEPPTSAEAPRVQQQVPQGGSPAAVPADSF